MRRHRRPPLRAAAACTPPLHLTMIACLLHWGRVCMMRAGSGDLAAMIARHSLSRRIGRMRTRIFGAVLAVGLLAASHGSALAQTDQPAPAQAGQPAPDTVVAVVNGNKITRA